MNGRGWMVVVGLVLLGTGLRCGGDAPAEADAPTTVDASGDVVDVADSTGERDAPAGDPGADAAPPDTSEVAADVGGDPDGAGTDTDADVTAQEVDGGTCTHDGFQVVAVTAATSLAAEGGFLELVAADSTTAPADVFGIELLLDERTLGPFVFVDENYATCERCIRIEAGCSNQAGCEKTFLVYAGTMDITAWEDPGGRFRATFTGLRAREVTISPDLPLTSTPVAGGETWCIDALTLDVAPLELF